MEQIEPLNGLPRLPVRRITWAMPAEIEDLAQKEWLLTNGLGGYAAGTLGHVSTRRYHGLLVAAFPNPLGRVMMLNHLAEWYRFPDGHAVWMGGIQRDDGKYEIEGLEYLKEFRLEGGLPTWRFQAGSWVWERQILMPYEQNTVHVNYRLLEGEGTVRVKLRPSIHIRGHDAHVDHPMPEPYVIQICRDQYEISAKSNPELPPLRFYLHGAGGAFTNEENRIKKVLYHVERRRGYPDVSELWSPGYFRVTLTPERGATLVASTEKWETILVLPPDEALLASRERARRLIQAAHPAVQSSWPAELVLAADQFVITPAGRAEEGARARATGDEVRTVIAGYHWFTDWGRDTMISLEGLTLVAGRFSEAGYILRTFAHYVRDGLIPNLFPEGEKEGLYHTADATLWFFEAVHRHLAHTQDRELLRFLLPTLMQIIEHHFKGTRFGIGVDPADGLLKQGAEGYQLTWMDAKVEGWVVTPRRGKAVEINALWYNALCLMQQWLAGENDLAAAEQMGAAAERVRFSFNQKFWNPELGYLFDVVDGPEGNDPACRPNQIFAVSLPHAVLDPARWAPVVQVVQDKLWTPVGLRSLARGHADYKPQYFGDLRARDAAYHQGTIWAWLIGPFIDAWLKVHPGQRQQARQFLAGFDEHLREACIGTISEIFDAEPPYPARGCVAQAWSVAEALRVWVATAEPKAE